MDEMFHFFILMGEFPRAKKIKGKTMECTCKRCGCKDGSSSCTGCEGWTKDELAKTCQVHSPILKSALTEKLRKEWLIALRSGDYSQTKVYLQNEFGFCCLGVACKIAEKDGIDVRYRDGYCGEKLLAGVSLLGSQTDVNNAFDFLDSGRMMLVNLNDNEGKTFVEIADFVEEHPELIFKDIA